MDILWDKRSVVVEVCESCFAHKVTVVAIGSTSTVSWLDARNRCLKHREISGKRSDEGEWPKLGHRQKLSHFAYPKFRFTLISYLRPEFACLSSHSGTFSVTKESSQVLRISNSNYFYAFYAIRYENSTFHRTSE